MELRRRDLDPDPFRQFERWYAEAAAAQEWPERTAVATADASGAPSLRMVLLKSFDERGLVFFTHATSRKGRELAATQIEQVGARLRALNVKEEKTTV